MTTKTKKANKTSVVKKVNTSLVNASIAALNTTVDNGEKWQKLASKLIKKSEKVRAQQINMIFDTAEAVKGQFMVGADKMKDLVGYDAELVEKAKDMAINNPVSRKVVGIIEDITEKVSENPMVQKAEKATEGIKNMGKAKFNEMKEDVLEQASKIIVKGEAIIADAKSTPKAKVVAKAAPRKTVAKKVATPKAKVVVKTAPKKTVAKKSVVVKKAPVAKKTVVKTVPKAKAPVAKKTVVKTAAKSKAPVAKKTVVKTAAKSKAPVAKKTVVKTAAKSKAPVAKKESVAKTEIVAKVAEVKAEVKK